MKRLMLPLLFAALAMSSSILPGKDPPVLEPLKPYRALVVVDRWSDPASVVVDSEKDEFQPVAALLQAKSLPFDIVRLDQQLVDASYLFDRAGRFRYGVVIWLADSATWEGQNLAALEEAAHAGTSVLAVRSRMLHPVLQRLMGLKFKEAYSSTGTFQVKKLHFITRELLAKDMESRVAAWEFSHQPWLEPQGSDVLIDHEGHPALTWRACSKNSSAIWMGPPTLTALRDSPYWHGLFVRSLVWSLGYLVLPDVNYDQRVVLMLDDWGASQNSIASTWHYPTLNEEQIRARLTIPVQERGGVVVANIVPGFVDRKSGRIVVPWEQKFTDHFGVLQDYTSTYRGLKAAVDAGVVEIQSHGFTHMQPDLESPPGPWAKADPTGEASAWGWYTEFEDQRREAEVPAIVQLFRMKQSRIHLSNDFGSLPLSLSPPGGAWSKSHENHTARLAAQAGFGTFHIGPRFFYLDRDIVLDMAGIGPGVNDAIDLPERPNIWPAHPHGPLFIFLHDRDLAIEPDFLNRLFAGQPEGINIMGLNEYVAILHSRIEARTGEGWQLAFDFEEAYCRHFRNRPSRWRLWLSDALRENLRAFSEFNLSVHGKVPSKTNLYEIDRETVILDLPAGLGTHTWTLSPTGSE